MFCPECGAPNEEDSVFCGNCGAPMDPDALPAMDSDETPVAESIEELDVDAFEEAPEELAEERSPSCGGIVPGANTSRASGTSGAATASPATGC